MEENIMNSKVNNYSRTQSYCIDVIEEEFKAWEYGLKLAKKLDIKINMTRWVKFKGECLMSYIKHYGKPKS
jgi:hypothetical protein